MDDKRKHILWIDLAHRFAQESKDRSTKVGSVIVGSNNRMISSGWNGMPEGVDDDIDERHERPAKYEWFIHAEMNAVANAARMGHATDGATLYIDWNPAGVCGRCIAVLRNAGIVRIVGPSRPFEGKGATCSTQYTSGTISKEIATETKIEIVVVDYDPTNS